MLVGGTRVVTFSTDSNCTKDRRVSLWDSFFYEQCCVDLCTPCFDFHHNGLTVDVSPVDAGGRKSPKRKRLELHCDCGERRARGGANEIGGVLRVGEVWHGGRQLERSKEMVRWWSCCGVFCCGVGCCMVLCCAVCGDAVWYCGVLFNTTLLCLYCMIAVL